MRHLAAIAAVSLLAASAFAQTGWRPRPIAHAREPADVIAHSARSDWRPIDPENLLIMDLADGGRVVIELAPAFAPVHVANMRRYARAGWWTNATVYRVQDNYVAQWGNNEAQVPQPAGVVAHPPAEYERSTRGLTIRPLGFPDAYAPIAGHVNGWPVGTDPRRHSAWLAPLLRQRRRRPRPRPDTGSGGELLRPSSATARATSIATSPASAG